MLVDRLSRLSAKDGWGNDLNISDPGISVIGYPDDAICFHIHCDGPYDTGNSSTVGGSGGSSSTDGSSGGAACLNSWTGSLDDQQFLYICAAACDYERLGVTHSLKLAAQHWNEQAWIVAVILVDKRKTGTARATSTFIVIASRLNNDNWLPYFDYLG